MAETNPIFDAVASTRLAIESTDCWRGIPIVWADDLYGESELPFAKYLFTFMDAIQWNQWEQWGDSFVTEVIEPVYYQLANDISWNLYWISVLDEEQLSQIDPSQMLSFSSNTEYTRNLMVPLEHLSEWIPMGRIPEDGTEKEIVAPSAIWLEQLDREGLAFCLDEYSQKALSGYVDGAVEARKTAGEPGDSTFNGQRLAMLQSITIQKGFREHYYTKDWTIPFQSVNLLYGLNGSGKTSVLSAIELAMTGGIRSLADTEDTSAETEVMLTIEVDGRTADLHPPRETAEKKIRERQFYNSRNTNRTAPQIQNLFHRFNYLSVEETFLFASKQPDISKIFAQVLYGPETINMWRNLEHYKKKCGRLIAGYKQGLENLVNQLKNLPKASPIDFASFRAYLTASGLRFDTEATLEEILAKTQTLLAEYDKMREFTPILSQNQLLAVQAELNEQIHIFDVQIEELAEELVQVEALKNDLIGQNAELQKSCQTIGNALVSIQALEPVLKQLQFRINHAAIFDEYQQCLARRVTCAKTVKQLKQFTETYAETLELLPSKSIQQIREKMRELRDKLQLLTEALGTQQSQIDQEELTQEKRTTLFSALRTAGLELYQLDEHRGICPLCGAKDITETILRKHLEKESTQGSQRLQELYQAALDTENEIKKTNSLLKKLGQEELIAQECKDALNVISKVFPEIQNVAALRQAYGDAQERLSAANMQMVQVQQTLQERLKMAGLDSTVEDIWGSRQKVLDNVPSEYVFLSSDVSDQELIIAVSVAQMKWEKQREVQSTSLSQIQNTLEQQKSTISLCRHTLKQKQEQRAALKREVSRLNQVAAFWKSIDTFIADTALSGEAVRNLCQRIHDMAHGIMESVQCEDKKRSCQKKMMDIEAKLARCHTLQSTLANLPAPNDCADAFISQNVSQISRIFLALHSPQEFSGLEIENHQLVAFRNGEKVPISHMSTGQRTALVIAVFFQMNLATPYAPSFLLLDEPVANIDDLNVLALMDFLREIVITHHRQIFFTTANRNVAKLFRRKFSFFLENFQELRFYREKEHCLCIDKRSYDQSKLLEHSNL